MDDSLPFLQPAEALLRLSGEDDCLRARPNKVSLPPRSLNDAYFLAHYVIRQSTHVGTHILHHIFAHPPGKQDQLAPLLLYRHILELGDSIGTLLRFGSATSATILMRSLFETSLALEFILQNNQFHEERASCYLAFYQIKRYRNFIRYDPGTTEGLEFHRILDSDPKLKNADFPRRDLSKERNLVETLLNTARYKPFWDRYQSMPNKVKKSMHWYGLCSNARDLRGLAKLIGRDAEYILLYKMVSEVAHAGDVMTEIIQGSTKGIEVHHLRGPVGKMKEVTSLSANLLVWCHELMLASYLNGHEKQQWFASWYAEKYRPFFMWAITPGPLFTK